MAVSVDREMCDRVADLIGRMSIPEDREDTSLDEFEPVNQGNFYLLLVAICHQTQSLQGTVSGDAVRGWDYLRLRLAAAVHEDLSLVTPHRWRTLTSATLTDIFRDSQAGSTLSDPDGRAELIRDLGMVCAARGWESLEALYDEAGRRVATGKPSLLELLSHFRAYDDPVRKKSLFLLGLMSNSHLWSFVDKEEMGPPVDYHEVRGHLRLGTVVVDDAELRKKLVDRHSVTRDEDIALRSSVYDAIMLIASRPRTPSPMALHYLFWNVFRQVCRREDPLCHNCPTDCGLPDRYVHLTHMGDSAGQCPFVGICASSDVDDRLTEPHFDTHWY